MIDPLLALRERVQSALHQVFGDEAASVDVGIHRSAHADYQADVALALARRLKRKPADVAAALVERLAPDEVLETAAVSGPGFINLTLRARYLAGEVSRMLADDRLGVERPSHPHTIVVDYSSPNLAKELHVGHLRTTIIGDSLFRVLDFVGHRVIRQNHIGDWGTPFGMLIEHMRDEQVAGGEAGLRELSDFYRAARAKFDADPRFADRARQRVVLLQSGDADTLQLWRQLIDKTVAQLEALYAKLDVALTRADIVGESHFNPDLPRVVADLERMGLTRVSEGALCVFPEGFIGREGEPQPVIVRKRDGGFGYSATDLAAVRYRVGTLGALKVVYVVGAPQQQHLSMIFAVARMAGWAGDSVRLDHVAFGSVLGKDKKMLKTRAGESVSLDALLDGAIERARTLIDEKSPEIEEVERAAIARAVGIGAVKYADLVNDCAKDYIFDWNRMLAFDGNTAPYLMYAHSRIRSILRKAGATASPPSEIRLEAPQERALALELLQFPITIMRTAEALQPHRLCQHLYDLATAFSVFYESCPVLKADDASRPSRLALCALTARVLAQGLALLGIAAPQKM